MKKLIILLTIVTASTYASNEANCDLDYYRGKFLFHEYQTASSDGNVLIGESRHVDDLSTCIDIGLNYMKHDNEVFKTNFIFTTDDGRQIKGEFSLD